MKTASISSKLEVFFTYIEAQTTWTRVMTDESDEEILDKKVKRIMEDSRYPYFKEVRRIVPTIEFVKFRDRYDEAVASGNRPISY